MKKNISHIYWFAAYSTICPSTRYRGVFPLQFLLEKHDISHDFITPTKSLSNLYTFLIVYLEILFFRKGNSLIVIQKVHSNRWYANALKLLIKLRSKNTLYDIDDAEQYRRDTTNIKFFLKNCTNVSVGSNLLKDYCLAHNPNVFVLTSPVSIKTCQHLKEWKNPKIHLGWVGDFGNGRTTPITFSHKASLYNLLFPNLKKIKYPIKLSLIGVKNGKDIPEIQDYFKDSPNIELDIPIGLDWKNDHWVYDRIKEFDLGISLMIQHPFNEAKSAFKAKQYLVCGVPVLSNKVGENLNFVFDQINGFICDSNQEIINAIDYVNQMPEEAYLQLSARCSKNIQSFSVETYCNQLLEEIVIS